MIKVKDSYGKIVRCFNTYKEASNYKFAYGNSNWQIIWEKKERYDSFLRDTERTTIHRK
jgi:hypothetical protein